MSYLDKLEEVAANDVKVLRQKDKEYGGSWKKRGGVGAFMMLARKWDRIENQCGAAGYDVFASIESTLKLRDGMLDDLGDLRRYLMLVEAEIRARHDNTVSVVAGEELVEGDLVAVSVAPDGQMVAVRAGDSRCLSMPPEGDEVCLFPKEHSGDCGTPGSSWTNLADAEPSISGFHEKVAKAGLSMEHATERAMFTGELVIGVPTCCKNCGVAYSIINTACENHECPHARLQALADGMSSKCLNCGAAL